jgi:hypothetical protein
MVRGVALSTAGVAALTKQAGQPIDDILANEHHELFVKSIFPQLKALGANVVRVYQVHPTHSHGKSMKILDDNNIYVMVGLATPEHSVKQMTGEYSYATFCRAAQVVDEFQAYDNTFCFSVGNEVEFPGQQASNLRSQHASWSDAEVVAATCRLELTVAQAMKSFARDIKAHIAAKSYRRIPVGVAMQDGPESSWDAHNPNPYQQGLIGTNIIAQYYAAGADDQRMDYIGINCYRYKTVVPAMTHYYDALAGKTEAGALPVPMFLTESGAFGSHDRDWADVIQIYGNPLLCPQLSGQVAFQLLDEGQGFGLYEVSASSGTITLNPRTTPGDGLAALQGQFAAAAGAGRHVKPASTTPTSPTSAPTKVPVEGLKDLTIAWPPLLPTFTAPDTSVTFINAAAVAVAVVQKRHMLGNVPAKARATVKVCKALPTDILDPTTTPWEVVCTVASGVLSDGSVVDNNVGWGGSCNVSSS